jgi:hypothetical protein
MHKKLMSVTVNGLIYGHAERGVKMPYILAQVPESTVCLCLRRKRDRVF